MIPDLKLDEQSRIAVGQVIAWEEIKRWWGDPPVGRND